MIELFYIVYAILTIMLIGTLIGLTLPKYKKRMDDIYLYVFVPQALMTVINLVFISDLLK